jgi:peptidoglycan hydrolase CwlO-like protein
MERRNRTLKKSIITLAVSITVGIGSIFGGVVVQTEAASISSLKEQQSKIQKEQSEVNSNIKNADEQINSIKEQQNNVKIEMTGIDLAINDTHAKMREKTAAVEETKVAIVELQEEIKVTKERIDKRNDLLKERARNYQLTGGMVSYLDVLMGSKSFSDFIDRANAVAVFMEADQEILKQHEEDKKSLETNQAKVEEELASLETMVAELEKMEQQLNAQRAEKNRLLATLEQQEEEIHDHKLGLEEEKQLLAAQVSAIQQAIKQEQDRLAAAAAAATANNNQSSGGGPTTAPPSSGSWVQPANGIFTSGFGTRPDFRPGEFHNGVDIANRASNVPIWAAADGVVIESKYHYSWGNVIFVAHSVNGQTYTTIYAHLEDRLVSAGATVKAGQQIGIMGTTGDSTGQHLHFELHRGGYKNPINPSGIVPLPN